MRKSLPERTTAPKEVYVDLVCPASGRVIPTVDWVAESLLKKGWKKVSDDESTKRELNNGEKKNR